MSHYDRIGQYRGTFYGGSEGIFLDFLINFHVFAEGFRMTHLLHKFDALLIRTMTLKEVSFFIRTEPVYLCLQVVSFFLRTLFTRQKKCGSLCYLCKKTGPPLYLGKKICPQELPRRKDPPLQRLC